MIRIYVCKWSKVGNRVMNPIMEYLDTQGNIPGFSWASMCYGESAEDGTPNNPTCMVFVKATDFTAIDALNSQFKIDKSTFASATTQKDVMNTLAKHIHPQFKSIGKHIDDKEFE